MSRRKIYYHLANNHLLEVTEAPAPKKMVHIDLDTWLGFSSKRKQNYLYRNNLLNKFNHDGYTNFLMNQI